MPSTEQALAEAARFLDRVAALQARRPEPDGRHLSPGMACGQAPDRPFPVEIAPSTTSHQRSLGYGVTDRLAPFASATFVQGQGKGQGASSERSPSAIVRAGFAGAF